MNPPGHTNCWKNIQAHDEQRRSAMAVYFCQFMQDTFQSICTDQNPLSNRALNQLCKSETSHNLLSTYKQIHRGEHFDPFTLEIGIGSIGFTNL